MINNVTLEKKLGCLCQHRLPPFGLQQLPCMKINDGCGGGGGMGVTVSNHHSGMNNI